MRPTVEEQLHGTCRILETVVAPHVAEPFARTILDNLVANLKMLTQALPKVCGFLRDDNAATLRQLLALRPVLAGELSRQIDEAAAAGEPDPADGSALEERNGRLRALLADAIGASGLTPDMRREIVALMVERASRVPMRYVPTVSAATKPSGSH
jgi:hypothetical protein